MDLIDFSRYFAALLIVLGLLGGFAVILRRGGLPADLLSGLRPLTGPASERRLKVRESLVLDPRRRVVIVKADDREHVVLLGAAGETVLESRDAQIEAGSDDRAPVARPVFMPVAPKAVPDDANEPTPRQAEGG